MNILEDKYGVMTLPKGSILYSRGNNQEGYPKKKSMIFTTFHPADWNGNYVQEIITKKDVRLLFMISYKSRGFKLGSILSELSGHEDLSKANDDNLNYYAAFIKQSNFDGWIAPIEEKSAVEIALINDSTIFTASPSKLINSDFSETYQISTIKNPVLLKLNKKYEEWCNNYINASKKEHYPFAHVMHNALICFTDYDETKYTVDNLKLLDWSTPYNNKSNIKPIDKSEYCGISAIDADDFINELNLHKQQIVNLQKKR